MKKMIAILVLCAFVSVSSAALVFQAPTEVQAGETFTLNVVSTEAGAFSYTLGALVVNGAAGWNTPVSYIGGTLSSPGILQDFGANAQGLAVWKAAGTNSPGVLAAANDVLFSIRIVAGAAGTVINIDDYVGASASIGMTGSNPATRLNGVAAVLDGATVNVVPEPMTMALLGLGGLFIRRRRA